MSTDENKERVRPNLRCVNLEADYWSKLKELAELEKRSISSYLRFFINKEHGKFTRNGRLALAG